MMNELKIETIRHAENLLKIDVGSIDADYAIAVREELVKIIKSCRQAYYFEDMAIVSDEIYDALKDMQAEILSITL